jgi:nicotinamidase-related amidase
MRKTKLILFYVCPQLDFIGLPGEIPNYSYPQIHLNDDAINKLRGTGLPGADPLTDFAEEIMANPSLEPCLVTDEDWHPENWWEFAVFDGPHCVKGTPGARLPERLESLRQNEQFFTIRANSLDVSTDPNYSRTLESIIRGVPRSGIRVGVAGVLSHLKVDSLVFNLLTAQPSFSYANICICEFLCASDDIRDHEAAMRKFHQLHLKIAKSSEEFMEWLEYGYIKAGDPRIG